MIHEFMVKEYQAGRVLDIRMYDFEFTAWLWKKIESLYPIEIMDYVIEVGVADGSFWDVPDLIKNTGHRMRIKKIGIGMPKHKKCADRYKKLFRVPVHRKVEVEPSDYVFCIDCINEIGKEEHVIQLFKNLTEYSKRYILITGWAIDMEVKKIVRTKKKFYWNVSNYKNILESAGFKLKGIAYYVDAINALYIFEKRI